jgi:hypothetical protein
VTQPARGARTTKTQPSEETAPDGEPRASGSATEGHVCNVAFCPVSLALTAAEHAQPDVVAHLLVAGREFFLAAKAVMDARADDLRDDGPPAGPARMEHIDIG